ncbi:DENN domain-containing protein Crag isoform X3 [Tribolium castaneum]|uniref:DENN domain-containing protein Crag isoform X3 n=1 Tax=Tribolium castaneum TaxID=7070 RepID=UPI0030FE0662
MDEKRVADYFVVAGLPDDPEPLDETTLSEGGNLKASHGQAPITDISVIFPGLGEKPPPGWCVVMKTPSGLVADLNHGSLRTNECHLCYKRGRDKPPLVDIGVMYDGKEWLMPDAEVVKESVGKHIANVNNSTSQTFITYRRGHPTMPCNALVVTDVCVVIASKGESPPHAFCCINKNLNKGIVGSDVFLCYKKSMNRAKLLTYKPSVLSRYPMSDLPNFPFPNSVPLFCLPMGATLELWPKEATRPKPVFSTFVLTVSDAKYKVYGSAVTFYEKFPLQDLSDEQRELLGYTENSDFVLNMNKSICLLSHWPFSDAFETWLLFLHNMVAGGDPQAIPVERYIVQLLDEVPFPSPRTLLELSDQNDKQTNKVIMTQPEDLPLPRSAAGFRHLLLNLGPENCLQVLLLALTEQKILIHSLRPDTLTAVAEAVSSFLFPFKWQCPYIPLCPLGLVEVLHAPLPFLIGVDSRFFDLYDPPPDVSCIDLDTNIITVAESQRQLLNIKLLPKKPAKSLKSALDYLYYQIRNNSSNVEGSSGDNIESEFRKKEKEQAQELEIQEAFLRFMALTLKGYRSYLLPITRAPTVGTTDPQALFQLTDFLKSRDKTHHRFFTLMMRTQMFIRFIEERSFVADGDQGLAFFDECSEKLSYEEGDIRLIEPDALHKSDRTIFVLPPEPNSDNPHVYTNFTLDPGLLSGKKRNHLPSLYQAVIPGSPMARRTKHEIKSAQKLARKCQSSPDLWARLLCGTCHTLYFMVLPSMLSLNAGKEKAILQQAYELLVRATQQRLACDEVCYRLMMQLCGEHSRPLLAVKLLVIMKKFGIQPNALTYGLYNRCVLEAEWPAYSGSSQLLWNKLRNVVMGAAHFRWAAKQKARKLSASTEGGSSLLEPGDRTASRSSLDSHEAVQTENSLLNKFRKAAANIVKGSLNGSAQSVKDVVEEEVVESQPEEPETKLNNHFTPPGSPSECRILSRSESAGDANIIDKLQQNKKNCSRTLDFNGEEESGKQSPGKVSPRTLVTQNDPLGAFDQAPPPKTSITPPPEPVQSNQNLLLTDDPVLFKSTVHRSATFEGSPPAQSKIHRSETVPAATVASSLASLGSSFKLGFSRYSPSRLSLRKADLKVPQQLFENAINNLSSIKSAANTMVKKLDEIKEAMSTSAHNTPVKTAQTDRLAAGDADIAECESNDGSDGGERHRRVSAELGSYRGSYTNLKDSDEPLPESLFPPPSEEKQDCELEITMNSCSQCHNCLSLLYDEDIMANWFAEDSNLNTNCQSCGKPTVPLLTTMITGKNIPPCDAFSVPYLNPLVLRKELENILTQEGDLSLADAKFVDEHPIIYWNLVWAFERINVQTHLPNLYLKTRTEETSEKKDKSENSSEEVGVMQPVEEGTDPLTQELAALADKEEGQQLAAQVCVRCLWDDPRLYSERPPMYTFWRLRDASQINKNIVTKSFMQKVIVSIRLNDLAEPLKNLASERESHGPHQGKNRISIYRDILFLACKALGRSHIDLNAFDKQYSAAYYRATERNNRQFEPQDKPLSTIALYCRQYFRPLSLP